MIPSSLTRSSEKKDRCGTDTDLDNGAHSALHTDDLTLAVRVVTQSSRLRSPKGVPPCLFWRIVCWPRTRRDPNLCHCQDRKCPTLDEGVHGEPLEDHFVFAMARDPRSDATVAPPRIEIPSSQHFPCHLTFDSDIIWRRDDGKQ